MEIKDFVATTIQEIIQGVALASSGTGHKLKVSNSGTSTQKDYYGRIEFDLAVEAKEGEKDNKAAGVGIKVLNAEIGKQTENSLSSVSRIKFTVMDLTSL